jgi:lipopolysaccharide/colanic/teichoic acid biosynthesis glycosyltransferase
VRNGPTTHRERTTPGGVPSPPPPPQPRSSAARTVKYAIDRLAAALAIVVSAPLFVLVALTLLALGRRRVLRVELRVGDRGEFPLVSFEGPPAGSHPWVARAFTGSGVLVLPQLFNLLRGDVSLIGPRPRYPGEPRPPARPGMAGLAQSRMATESLDRAEVFALDAEYAERWSLGLDLQVILHGARHLITPRR